MHPKNTVSGSDNLGNFKLKIGYVYSVQEMMRT